MTDIAPIQDIIAEIRAGRMVVLVDEEDRENEGDLVFAAEFATPEKINFMAKHGRGLICLTLTEDHCKQLNLPLMVRENAGALALRLVGGLLLVAFVGLLVQTLASDGGRPGSVVVTLIFVFVGIALQLTLGLGLAMLAVQQVPWRRFFRILFLIPLTITPVGVGYMFLMMTDTSKGPFEPLWVAFGLRNFTWVTDPWLARLAVVIGDTWQWTPFVFIVLLAALESLDQEVREAALVDGASRWQSFRHITAPAILPVTTTIILIRIIEGFKIIDMPNILLGGGPGTATQSMTLEAYLDWNTLNLGRSAAVAYLLLILVSIVATVYVSFVRRRVTDLA